MARLNRLKSLKKVVAFTAISFSLGVAKAYDDKKHLTPITALELPESFKKTYSFSEAVNAELSALRMIATWAISPLILHLLLLEKIKSSTNANLQLSKAHEQEFDIPESDDALVTISGIPIGAFSTLALITSLSTAGLAAAIVSATAPLRLSYRTTYGMLETAHSKEPDNTKRKVFN